MKPLLSILLSTLFTGYLIAQAPLPVGSKAPDAQLTDMEGTSISLQNILQNKTTVIIFYRGGWCPYCNTHLSDLQGIEKSLKKMNCQLLAITPENWEKLSATKMKNFAKYNLYSDPNFEAISGFGIKSGSLPIPSAFIIDQEGIIRFVHADRDYKKRIDAETLLAEVQKVIP